MRIVIGLLITLAMAGGSFQPALAAYCGPIADTKAVETLAISQPPHDRTRIMYLAVVQTFAKAEVEWKGELGLYFRKHFGSWKYAGTTPPENMPASVMKRFDKIMNASPHTCTNPNFVSHPSGK